jgi:hypothetical protein
MNKFIASILFLASCNTLADLPAKLACEYTYTDRSFVRTNDSLVVAPIKKTELAWFDFKKATTAWIDENGKKEYWPIEQGDDPHIWHELDNGKRTGDYYTFSKDYDRANYTWDEENMKFFNYSEMRCKKDK